MALEKFNWQNGTQIEPAKVEIGGQSYNVSDAQFEGETPLSAGNLNLMQDTLLGNVVDNLSDDTKIPNVKAVKGKVLWSNTSSTPTSFSSQTITLSSDDYDSYEIIFTVYGNTNNSSTGIIPKGKGTQLVYLYNETSSSYSSRRINYTNDTTLSVGNCYGSDYPEGQAVNTRCIPLYVIGHNTGLFS